MGEVKHTVLDGLDYTLRHQTKRGFAWEFIERHGDEAADAVAKLVSDNAAHLATVESLRAELEAGRRITRRLLDAINGSPGAAETMDAVIAAEDFAALTQSSTQNG